MKRRILMCLTLIFYMVQVGSAIADDRVDSLKQVVATQDAPTDLASSYYALAVAYYNTPEEALPYITKALEFAKASGESSLLAKSGYVFGLINEDLVKHRDAFLGFHEALNAYKEIGDEVYVARCYQGIGRLYMMAQQVDKAKSSFDEASAYLSTQPADTRSEFYVDLADLYLKQENYPSAESYYHLAMDLTEDPLSLSYIYMWLGNTYLEQKKFSEALQFYNKASAEAEKTSYGQYYNGLISINKAVIAQGEGRYQEAIDQFETTLDEFSDVISIYESQVIYNGMAKSYVDLGNLSQASEVLNHAISLGQDPIGYNDQYLKSYQLAISTSEAIGDLAGAFAYQQAYQSELITHQEAEAEVAEAKAVLEVQLAENEILTAELASANRTKVIAISIAAGLGATVLIFLLIRIYNRHQRLRGKFTRKQAAIRELKRMAVTEEW